MKFLQAAIMAAVAAIAFTLSSQPSFAGGYHHPFHVHHVYKPHHPVIVPPAQTPSNPKAATGGGGLNTAPAYIGGGFAVCVFANAVDKKRKAKVINGVHRTTYREEAAIVGDCLIPIPVRVDGQWRTVGAEVIWFLTGRRKGYADPDFAIRQQEARDRNY